MLVEPSGIPEDNLELRVRRDHVPYDVWERQGYLQTTEGNVVHYGYIEKFIESLGERFNIREIAFDRWGAVQMVQNLEGMGFTVVPFGQGFKDMSPPTKELMKLVLEQKIAHGGHPVLRWMMDNIFIRTDPAGNIKPDKEKSTEKIDGAVATIMALDRAIRCGNDKTESVYTASCNGLSSSNTTGSALSVGKIAKSGSVTVTLTITDSRGYTASVSQTITVIPYAKPKVSSVTLRRTNDIEAEMQLKFSGSISAVTVDGTQKNSVVYVRYRYKKTSESS